MQIQSPLSFSQNYHQSLKYLVEQALISLGCPADKLTNIHSHSSIHLEFDSLPSITLNIEDDRLWLWSAFTDLTFDFITQQASELFIILQEPIPLLELEQAILVKATTGYELKALVDISCLHSPQNLGMLIKSFHEKVDAINQVLTMHVTRLPY
ncbi:InvB/SpaK family type III secretion system chaperone [Shewanella surugensis]|uniref:Uncharacterized protein n=1 Tax=Shewanella surugensis TaxID=212020 RepID=A0ABT0LKB9_9GAMM|nr:hypothetical protein [Shewanella surugensis]MCL1127596.1 hypothetical protein [Shewanella surugensis]